jgi:hypothetical protein
MSGSGRLISLVDKTELTARPFPKASRLILERDRRLPQTVRELHSSKRSRKLIVRPERGGGTQNEETNPRF